MHGVGRLPRSAYCTHSWSLCCHPISFSPTREGLRTQVRGMLLQDGFERPLIYMYRKENRKQVAVLY